MSTAIITKIPSVKGTVRKVKAPNASRNPFLYNSIPVGERWLASGIEPCGSDVALFGRLPAKHSATWTKKISPIRNVPLNSELRLRKSLTAPEGAGNSDFKNECTSRTGPLNCRSNRFSQPAIRIVSSHPQIPIGTTSNPHQWEIAGTLFVATARRADMIQKRLPAAEKIPAKATAMPESLEETIFSISINTTLPTNVSNVKQCIRAGGGGKADVAEEG